MLFVLILVVVAPLWSWFLIEDAFRPVIFYSLVLISVSQSVWHAVKERVSIRSKAFTIHSVTTMLIVVALLGFVSVEGTGKQAIFAFASVFLITILRGWYFESKRASDSQ
ncbi:MAG: hypothetical protein MI864_07655 [Pseudomonadales bacterium]|nr:hypothetical protein [Pseudomonadales bacterium]